MTEGRGMMTFSCFLSSEVIPTGKLTGESLELCQPQYIDAVTVADSSVNAIA